MAGTKEQAVQVPSGIEFELVDESFDTTSGARRNPSSFTIKNTGLTESNVEGALDVTKFLKDQGLDPVKAQLKYGANVQLGLIALYGSSLKDTGTMGLRWFSSKKTVSFHLGAVFKKHPELRPSTTVEAFFEPGTDKNGRPCLIIRLQGALTKRKGATEPDSQAAAARQAKT